MRYRSATLFSIAPLTMGFFSINCVLFVYEAIRSNNIMTIDSNVLFNLGASSAPGLWEGEWLRLIAPNFLHGGILHIAFNNYFLYQAGPATEVYFGSANFGVLYLLSGITGFCFSQIFGQVLSIGASASLMGIMGAQFCVMVLRCPRPKYAWRNSEVRRQAQWLGIFFFLGIMGTLGPVDNWGHLGGLLAGAGLGGIFEIWRTRHRLGVVFLLSAVLVIGGLICAARWSVFNPYYHVHMAMLANEEGRQAESEAQATEALRWGKFWHNEETVAEVLKTGYAKRWSLDNARHGGYKYLARVIMHRRSTLDL
jgi:rhomboid protease GluP